MKRILFLLFLASSHCFSATNTNVMATRPWVLSILTNRFGTNNISVVYKQVSYTTNAGIVKPDFGVSYSYASTNASFTFLAPTNVLPYLDETTVLIVTNSSGTSNIVATAPANCSVVPNSNMTITNRTIFTFHHYGNVFTNVYGISDL